MNRINILHIYQNSKIGGIQRQLFNVLSAYDKEIFNPIFCCLGNRQETGVEIEKLGIEFIPLNRVRYHNFSTGIIIALYRLMKKKRIHIVRTHKYRSNFYGRIAAWLAGVPVIIASEHNIYIDKELRLSRRIINRLLSLVTDKMVAVSDAIRKDLIHYDGINPAKVMVIRNGVDTDMFTMRTASDSLLNKYSIKKGDFVLGFVGRMVPQKGLTYILDAAEVLCRKFDNLKLILAGDGSLMDELKSKSETLNIADKVFFLGERRDISDLMTCFDIFVIPSIKEGLPNVLLEAMAAGKPVVATSVGGIPEIIKNGTSGILVEPSDAVALASAIERLINEPLLAKEMGNAARKIIIENYGMNATVQKWQLLYKSILKDKGLLRATDPM